jgi:hypothetical protein
MLNIGGREIESIQSCVGEASTIANLIMTSDIHKRTYGQLSGWFPDTGKGDNDVADIDYNSGYYWRKKIYNNKKKFAGIFPLKYLLGFTEYEHPFYLIKISLELNRKDDSTLSDEIFYGAAATTGKVSFTTLEWHIPHITPSLEIADKLTKRLNTNKPIDLVFLKRSMNDITIPTGNKYSWKIGNYTNSVRFAFIAFKNTTAPSPQINNCLFTEHSDGDKSIKITSIRVQLNGMYYPIDEMKFNFDEYNIAQPYLAYINCSKMFGNEPSLTVQEFHDLYPIYCIDLSSQPETIKSNGIDVTVHIEKSSTLTLQAYCLVLEDSYFKIDTIDGKMVRIS